MMIKLVTHVDGSRGAGFYLRFCVSVCLFFPHDISSTDAARITKLDIEMFHDESWNLIYFGVKRSKVKVTSYKNIAGVCLCWLCLVPYGNDTFL